VAERACGAVYRAIREGGPARSCVLPAGHEGDHEDVRAIDESRCAFWARAVKAEHKLTALRARVAELEAEDARWRKRWASAVAGRIASEAVAYERGAEAMRERAAKVLDDRSRDASPPMSAQAVLRRAAKWVRSLPLDADAANVCEHGDHPAPEGQRFCSKACQRCEAADAPEDEECAGICDADAGEESDHG